MISTFPKETSNYQKFYKIPFHRDSAAQFSHLSKRNKPVLFIDIDNTLYKENNGMDMEIKQRILQFCSLFHNDEEASRKMTHYYFSYGHTLRGYLKEISDPLCTVEKWKEVYDKVDIERYLTHDPEMYKKLMEFKKNNILYAFTNGDCDIGMRMLNSLGMSELFEGIIYCDYKDGGDYIGKPDEEAYELMEQIFGKEKLFIFEDRMINLTVPMRRGWQCYLVTVENDLKMILDELSYLI